MQLIYYRCYTSYDLLEYLFGVDSSTVCLDIAKIVSAVKRYIPILSKLYADSKKINDIIQLLQFFTELITIIYWYRTINSETQKSYQEKDTLFRKKENIQSKIKLQLISMGP